MSRSSDGATIAVPCFGGGRDRKGCHALRVAGYNLRQMIFVKIKMDMKIDEPGAHGWSKRPRHDAAEQGRHLGHPRPVHPFILVQRSTIVEQGAG